MFKQNNNKVETIIKSSEVPQAMRLNGFQRLRECALILGILLSCLMLIALMSFSPADPSWSQTAWGGAIQNKGGVFGAWFADTLFFTFGSLAYLIPLLLMVASWVICRRRGSDDPIDFTIWGTRLLGLAILILTSCGLADINFDDIWYFSSGGVIGDVLTTLSMPYFNLLGTTLVLLFLWGAGFTLFSGISWLSIVEWLGDSVISSFTWLVNRVRGTQQETLEPTLSSFDVALSSQAASTNPTALSTTRVAPTSSHWDDAEEEHDPLLMPLTEEPQTRREYPIYTSMPSAQAANAQIQSSLPASAQAENTAAQQSAAPERSKQLNATIEELESDARSHDDYVSQGDHVSQSEHVSQGEHAPQNERASQTAAQASASDNGYPSHAAAQTVAAAATTVTAATAALAHGGTAQSPIVDGYSPENDSSESQFPENRLSESNSPDGYASEHHDGENDLAEQQAYEAWASAQHNAESETLDDLPWGSADEANQSSVSQDFHSALEQEWAQQSQPAASTQAQTVSLDEEDLARNEPTFSLDALDDMVDDESASHTPYVNTAQADAVSEPSPSQPFVQQQELSEQAAQPVSSQTAMQPSMQPAVQQAVAQPSQPAHHAMEADDEPVADDQDVAAFQQMVASARAAEQAKQNPFLVKNDVNLPVPTEPLPTLELLYHPEKRENFIDRDALEEVARLVESKLADYKIKAKVVGIFPGPVITRFELDLAPGVKVSRISSLSMDLARSLSAMAVRVVEVIPGKPYVGLELPNMSRQTVYLSDVVASPVFQQASSPTTVVLGQDIAGDAVIADLSKMPHVLVAGTTGSGKSVGVNVMILSMLYKASPEEVRFIMIDPKMLELSVYEGIPHLLAEVVTDMKDASNALRWCVGEMERRYALMSKLGVRNIKGFNEKLKMAADAGHPIHDPLWKEGDSMDAEPPLLESLPYIVVVVDEFADLMMVVGKKVEELIARLAQKARAAGIHLILATQRPSVDVITGLIKANIPTRVAFTVSTKTDSRTILDQGGAESLLGMGDMLYLPPGSSHTVRVHGAFASDDDVHAVVNNWKARGKPNYIEEIISGDQGPESLLPGEQAEGDDDDLDPLFDQVVEYVVQSRRGSISGVQRRFKIGYNRAARIIDQLESQGIVSAQGHNGNREVLAPPPMHD